LENAEGTFLWIGLMIRQLERAETIDEILDILEEVPTGLHNLYTQLLERIKPGPRSALHGMLCWILVARRILMTKELAATMDFSGKHGRTPDKILGGYLMQCHSFFHTITGDRVQYHQGPTITGDRVQYHQGPTITDFVHTFMLDPPQEFLKVVVSDDEVSCSRLMGMIKHDPSIKTKLARRRPLYTTEYVFVMLSHQSMRDFFPGTMTTVALKTQHQLVADELEWHAAQRCLEHLSHSAMRDDWVCTNDPEVRRQYPFLGYSIMYWPSHARDHAGPSTELADTSHTFLQTTATASVLRFRWFLSCLLRSNISYFIFGLRTTKLN
jgi:hypothetical protein